MNGGILVHGQAGNWSTAKSFGSGQPARTAQADLSRYFLQRRYASFSHSIVSVSLHELLSSGECDTIISAYTKYR